MQRAVVPPNGLAGNILRAFVLRRLQAATERDQNTYSNNILTLHKFLEKKQSLSVADQNLYYKTLCHHVQHSLNHEDFRYIENFVSNSQHRSLLCTRNAVKELFRDVFVGKTVSWLKIAAVMKVVADLIIRDAKNLILVKDVGEHSNSIWIDAEGTTLNRWIAAHNIGKKQSAQLLQNIKGFPPKTTTSKNRSPVLLKNSSESIASSLSDSPKPHILAPLINCDKLYLRAKGLTTDRKEIIDVFCSSNNCITRSYYIKILPNEEQASVCNLKNSIILKTQGGLKKLNDPMLLNRYSRSSKDKSSTFAKISEHLLEDLINRHRDKLKLEREQGGRSRAFYISKVRKMHNQSVEKLCKIFSRRSSVRLEFTSRAKAGLTHTDGALILMTMVKLYYSVYRMNDLPQPFGFLWQLPSKKDSLPDSSVNLLAKQSLQRLRLRPSVKSKDGDVYLDALNADSEEIELIIRLTSENSLLCYDQCGRMIFQSSNISEKVVAIVDREGAYVGEFQHDEHLVNFWIRQIKVLAGLPSPGTKVGARTETSYQILEVLRHRTVAAIRPERSCVLVDIRVFRMASENAIILTFAVQLALINWRIGNQILKTRGYYFRQKR